MGFPLIQTDGKIVIVGNCLNTDTYTGGSDIALARFNVDGSLDNNFGKNGIQVTDLGDFEGRYTIALQNDGKIIVAGNQFVTGGGSNVGVIVRCNIDGSLDNTFSDDGVQKTGAYYNISALAIQNNDKIVIGGTYGYDYRGQHDPFAVIRLNSDGTNDDTFNGGNAVNSGVNVISWGTSVLIQPDNKIIVGGYSYNGSSDDFTIARYNVNGSFDNTFGIDGIQTLMVSGSQDRIASIALGFNGLYAVGYGQFPGNFGVVARFLLTEGAPPPIKLNDFTASLQNKSVLLKWQTSSEENLAGFTIQRSVDATNFSAIGYVVAKGNSNTELSYSSIDWQPIHGVNH